MLSSNDIALRLIASAILGGIVGLERERHNQPAGFRTHTILCLGASLITLVSIFMAEEFGNLKNSDPTRIAAQVVTGVGFLGAGAILRFGASIKGLTTAASLWTTAGIGMGIGAGFYYGSVLATLIIIVTLGILGKVEKLLIGSKADKTLLISAKEAPGILGKIEHILVKYQIGISNIRIIKNLQEHSVEINAIIQAPKDLNISLLSKDISLLEEISEVEIR
ncbi:MAG: hypothetical protein A3C43_06160 [Candidatus Schekmanbacteria bacterium RIFCSPHIGHO2_02_FULL_38_11]|uniref:MgtC/SapB/SrpB/YhiD N-terminal domain-containing protein n=1 Tax=Candidatus Schekmanbacteria bacterium RIFCSPLOWO2_12_FULL_38_15 TaxID=1817883 RepID=A0A1F7SFN1_9BACT|nr:MAG: hypothetical protein A2043_11655 [Candidatus Schekmanbacteria bacterium GWA2_38_9]OGL48612.1 MAG: hypothetical protein A3H37_05980 [Candidatus Schekmanbacteria bacterium RIFCSPLOWO2_02_FULL_38_14]OGL50157.1 MAG: hypothetical protein A3C43_06160 [Candidatus Schekmanbacteria bacterium RIFCSPHIGHO2_02_FULL_38_11]OGL52592.1 MAG: hypothetical protein A3G31_11540 [Candidatus Schekmanbacteria bacterium RIFCSPLOWO2_12_FULL_38_15]